MTIDYVMPYLDSSNEAWQKLYKKYANENHQSDDENEKRFYTNMFFKFVFRGIEQYMPWINNIFLLVQDDSHVPKWINRNTVKIITHDQFIPKEYLPTFNSCTIECFLHRIPGLSNFFIYGNDDMYVFDNVKQSQFFDNGMPLNTLVKHSPIYDNSQYCHMMMQMTYTVHNLLNLNYNSTFYYSPRHIQNAFSKPILSSIFNKHTDIILNSISKFRENKNLSQYFFTNYYMLSTNSIYKMKHQKDQILIDLIQSFDKAVNLFKTENKYKLVCLNNNNPDKDIILYHFFSQKFLNKSKYEI